MHRAVKHVRSGFRRAWQHLSETKQSAILGICFLGLFVGTCYYFGKYAPQLAPSKPAKGAVADAQVVPVAVRKVWFDDPKRRTDIVTRQ